LALQLLAANIDVSQRARALSFLLSLRLRHDAAATFPCASEVAKLLDCGAIHSRAASIDAETIHLRSTNYRTDLRLRLTSLKEAQKLRLMTTTDKRWFGFSLALVA